MDEYIRKIAMPQVKEILTNYDDLAVLWWDTPTDMTKERADMLQPLIPCSPGIITNNRLRRRLQRRFDHPRTAYPGDRTGLRLGNLHDHERHMGV